LTISLDGLSPLTSLANVYIVNPGHLTADNQWDGSATATNGLNNQLGSHSDLITFAYAPGAESFGIGLGSFQSLNSPSFPITNHSLIINGSVIGSIEALAGANWSPGVVRNAYVRIDATGGDVISSIGILNNSQAPSPAQQDFLLFDRLAILQPEPEPPGPVPEPSTALLLAAGLAACGWRRFRARRMAPWQRLITVLVAVLFLGVLDARAASWVAASIDSPIWGGFGTGGGVGGCTFFTGPAGVPVATVFGGCAHEYTTTTGLESKITVSGGAYAEYGNLGAIASGSWTKFGAPSQTGGNWGVTSSSAAWSAAETRLEGSISNRLNYTREFGIIAKISGSGNMFFDNPSRVVGFPWTGQVEYFLTLTGSNSGGCGGSFRVNYSDDFNDDPTNEPVPLNECSAALISTLAPGESMPFILSTGLSAKVETNSWTTNGAAWGADYGMSADFYHTLRISSLEFRIDGQLVDPDAFGITTDAPVRFTSSGIVPLGAEVPEAGTGFLFMLCGGLLALGSSGLRHRNPFRLSRRG
jgi:hypothetical protein